MSILLKHLLTPYMAPAGDDGSDNGGGGGSVDRGDDFTPTDEGEGDAGSADKGEASDEGEGGDADEGDDPPRDKKGRFTKGDAADEDEGDEGDEGKDADKGGAKGKKAIMIPKGRFDEARSKHREREQALQARIEALEKQSQREAQTDDVKKLNDEIETLESDYSKALTDGKADKAQELMKAIRLKERRVVEIETSYKSAQAKELAVEEFKLDSLVSKLEADFPQLNPDSDEYSQEVVDEIGILRKGFENGGLASSQALAKAAKYVLGAAQKKTDDEPERRGLGADGKDKGADRRQKQLKKNLDAAGKQPPRMDDAGVDSSKKGGGVDAKSVNRMTEEEFAALPESTKSRLRGDVFDENALA
jgi:hypothetical protein